MKEYQKPEMKSVEFKANESVAACEMSSNVTYDEQTVNCMFDGSDTIFGDNCKGNATTKGYLVDYNDKTYFVWYNGKIGARPTDTSLLDTLVGMTGNKSGAGWHAGVATSTIISALNNS